MHVKRIGYLQCNRICEKFIRVGLFVWDYKRSVYVKQIGKRGRIGDFGGVDIGCLVGFQLVDDCLILGSW